MIDQPTQTVHLGNLDLFTRTPVRIETTRSLAVTLLQGLDALRERYRAEGDVPALLREAEEAYAVMYDRLIRQGRLEHV